MQLKALAALLLVSSACEPVPREGAGSLRGLVIDARDDEPVAGVTVRGEPGGWQIESDDDGTFAMGLPAGAYQVTVTREGRRTSDPLEVVVHRGRSTDVTLVVPDVPDELRVRMPVGVVQAGYGKLVTLSPYADPAFAAAASDGSTIAAWKCSYTGTPKFVPATCR